MCGETSSKIPEVDESKLYPDGFSQIGAIGAAATTGLDSSRVKPNGPSADEVINFLKVLNYAPLQSIDNDWDCSERALWGIIHARRKFSGCAIAMAEGKGPAVNGEDHAVIIVWDRGLQTYRYWDPLFKDNDKGDYKFGPIARIIGFPGGGTPAKDPAPIKDLNMSRIQSGNFVSWDTKYKLYPLTTPDRKGVLDYLGAAVYDKAGGCDNFVAHQGGAVDGVDTYWRDADRAYWVYMHVRRQYRGCAIGVAFGEPKKAGISRVVNVLWHGTENDIKRMFLDPAPKNRNKDVTDAFDPKMFFF
jgi:hypothetical protein